MAKKENGQAPRAEGIALPPDLLTMLKEWSTAYKRSKELEAEVKRLAEEMGRLEGPILTGLEVAEIERLSMDGLTIYQQEQLWVKTGPEATPQMVAEALRKSKLPEFTTFNSQSLSSYLREQASGVAWEDPKELLDLLPKALRSIVEITNKQSLRARKSN
ncbi:MAG: hypothetical protein A4E73_02400 [Syntrophaceae bacterium PtaU1.Bin231]|nr:MAG: hypothetical protein A4E73_02400 [Syntrophaceae bacterium PtaU1.Bin231]